MEELQAAVAVLNADLSFEQLCKNFHAVGGLPKAMNLMTSTMDSSEEGLPQKLQVSFTKINWTL